MHNNNIINHTNPNVRSASNTVKHAFARVGDAWSFYQIRKVKALFGLDLGGLAGRHTASILTVLTNGQKANLLRAELWRCGLDDTHTDNDKLPDITEHNIVVGVLEPYTFLEQLFTLQKAQG